MDPAKETPIRSAVELQGAMLGRHEEELAAARYAVESLSAQVFDRSVYGHEASRQLATLRQGRPSAADFTIEFRTLAATCEWNEPALTARFLEGLTGEIKEEILAQEGPSSETILPSDHVVGAVTWGIEWQVKKALARVTVPRECPVERLFIPSLNLAMLLPPVSFVPFLSHLFLGHVSP
ncbi:Pol poly [Labeo rohita]|uniref:Pol poly n=1 Tax=Labeo rohita TaxID=84645 RepID=A0A498LEF4_LABRO|nr:Pol poly [Labeo rohita]RXN23720.1 Pol poly [Labeo rohita]